jgi:hypothetical protein
LAIDRLQQRCTFVHKRIFAACRSGLPGFGTHPSQEPENTLTMETAKTANGDARYTHPVRTRVTRVVYQRLEKLIEKGDCHSIGEVSRKILSNEQIKVFHMDASLNMAMEELAQIRKELKAIGVNINQLTKAFHSSPNENAKAFYALKVAGRYEAVGIKVDALLSIVSQLAEKWLQRS